MNRLDIISELLRRGYKAEEKDVVKNGVVFEGIIIKSNDSNIAPVIYVNHFIEEAKNNSIGLSDVVTKILRLYEENKNPGINISQITDRDFILSHILICLQRSSEEEIVKQFTELEGIESYLYVRSDDGHLSYKVRSELLRTAGISLSEAWEAARKNTFAESRIMSMADVFIELGGSIPGIDELDNSMFVISNKSRFRGASAILNTDMLIEFANANSISKFIFIPSSIHEGIIFLDDEMDMDFFNSMVTQANDEAVDPEERLSDRAYIVTINENNTYTVKFM